MNMMNSKLRKGYLDLVNTIKNKMVENKWYIHKNFVNSGAKLIISTSSYSYSFFNSDYYYYLKVFFFDPE